MFGRRTLPQMDLASVSCAIQNLWLAARAEGLGMGWVSIFEPRRLADLLGMPDDAEPVAILCLGPVPEFPDRPALEIDEWAFGRPLERVRVREQLGYARADRRLVDVTVDLNADLGESFGVWKLGDDDAMLDVVTSANVACGFHAGDPALLLRTCRAAAERDVRIGAQVSYRDLAGFGRRFIDADPEDLKADVIYQIGALQAIAQAAARRSATSNPMARCTTRSSPTTIRHGRSPRRCTLSIRPCPCWACPVRCSSPRPQDLGLRTVPEAFADRAYRSDGQLVSRRQPNAVLRRRRGDRRPGVVDGDRGPGGRGRRIDDSDHRRINLRARGFAGRGADRQRGS